MAKTDWKNPLKETYGYPNVNHNCTVTGSVDPGKYYAVVTVNEKHESGNNYIVGWTNFTAPVESRQGEASRISIGGAEFAWQEGAGGDSFSFSLALKDVRNNSSWGSGKLNLDLWYCKEPYKGGSIDGFRLFTGMPVSFSEGGRTGIQAGTSKSRAGFSAKLPLDSAPPSGKYSVLFVLTEDNADGTKKQAGYYNYEWQTDWREQTPAGQMSELSLDDFSYELKAGRLTVTPKVTNASAWETRPLTLEFYLCKQQGYAGGEVGGTLMAQVPLGPARPNRSLGGTHTVNVTGKLKRGQYWPLAILREDDGNGGSSAAAWKEFPRPQVW